MSFTCPRCGRVSHNPNDEREGYCGACHDWVVREAQTVNGVTRRQFRDAFVKLGMGDETTGDRVFDEFSDASPERIAAFEAELDQLCQRVGAH